MFSYRHAFHAGNHADVLKHTVLIAALQYLTEKDAALTVLDTHAGAGLYRLDGDYARTSGEAGEGILRLTAPGAPNEGLAPLLQAYVDMVRAFNQGASTRVYPGSPFIIQRLLRACVALRRAVAQSHHPFAAVAEVILVFLQTLRRDGREGWAEGRLPRLHGPG